jgi:hypothetical protein
MERHIERNAGVRPAEELRDDEQVCAARDREEFAQPLDDAEHGRLQRGHGAAR